MDTKKTQRILESPLGAKVTAREKEMCWREICEEVNAVSSVCRTTEDVRRKWRDFKSVSKKKGAAIKRSLSQTNGGVADTLPLDPQEERVICLMGETAISGIEDGIEVGLPMSTSQDDLLELPSNTINIAENNLENEENISLNVQTVERREKASIGSQLLAGQKEILTELKNLVNVQKQLVDLKSQELEIKQKYLEIGSLLLENVLNNVNH